MRLYGPVEQQFENMKVKDLFLPGLKRWDVHTISNLLHPNYTEAMLNVPLFESDRKDTILWWPNKHGFYSVKTAYNLFMEKIVDLSHLHREGDWEVIWKMNLPQKIKKFLWRCCQEVLHVRCNLQRKGVTCPAVCVIYSASLENSRHIFLFCAVSIECWKQVKLWDLMAPFINNSKSFVEFFFKLVGSLIPSKDSCLAGLHGAFGEQGT